MRKMQKVKATGILEDIFRPIALSANDRQTLDRAQAIRFRHSSTGRVNEAISEIRTYVMVSNHSIPQKIENLKADWANSFGHK